METYTKRNMWRLSLHCPIYNQTANDTYSIGSSALQLGILNRLLQGKWSVLPIEQIRLRRLYRSCSKLILVVMLTLSTQILKYCLEITHDNPLLNIGLILWRPKKNLKKYVSVQYSPVDEGSQMSPISPNSSGRGYGATTPLHLGL
jgi:hypothetical protein